MRSLSNEDEIRRATAAINRRNAKKSTGPKTAAGKAQASRNAFRHGLAVPIDFLPELAKRRDQIADAMELAGVVEGAAELAEAVLQLERIQAIRHAALNGQMVDGGVSPSPTQSRSSLHTLRSMVRYENEARASLRRLLRQSPSVR